MGKVEDALRSLIQYHGRRAARDVMEGTPARLRELRQQVRDLQASVEGLEEKVETLMTERRERMTVPPAPEEELEESRVTRRTLTSMRKRFELTQGELAELLDVSTAAITQWETGRTRPRAENAARIITLREMGKREVDEALGRTAEEMGISGTQVRDLRERLGLTQKELADLVGVSIASVTNWERGETEPGRENCQKISQLQDLSSEEARQQLEAAGSEGGMTPQEIRELREVLDLSQAELAEKIGVSTGSVSNWETGKSSPRSANVQRLKELVETSASGGGEQG